MVAFVHIVIHEPVALDAPLSRLLPGSAATLRDLDQLGPNTFEHGGASWRVVSTYGFNAGCTTMHVLTVR